MTYNIIFLTESKDITTYTNLFSKQEFFDTLWEWSYVDDLYDFIDETEPNLEQLTEYIDNIFIDENMFHEYTDDEVSCYAFCVKDGVVSKYYWAQDLEDYIMNRVLEYYHEVNGKFYRINDSVSYKY